jgi:hypothetical protein
MTYKIVRNAAGELICFGPNNNHYEPTIKAGETLTIEDAIPPLAPPTYKYLRAQVYPSITDYIDGIVKGDTVQVQSYIDACLAVKEKYPKGTK